MAAPGNQSPRVNARLTAERWKRVKAIFDSALNANPSERTSFLIAECSGDTDLLQEVESLLASHQEADDFIEAPPSALKPLLATESKTETVFLRPGTRIGAYELVRELGSGGMGSVYLASRADEEFRKNVAIKLIRQGMETDFAVRRFRNERQILARLEHANIARLLDGGSTPEGLPYFVMEYVDGVPLTEYCEREKLPVNERLKLFLEICEGVQYAHERDVVHRDLKPRNILINKHGEPKLLDFGIAKMLGPEHDGRLETTLMGLRLMTPAYASPEQLRGDPATCKSDIYALGVVLFELLEGRRPSDSTLSTSTLPENLNIIVRKAIRELPDARYESASAMAEQIRQYLAGDMVEARETSLAVLPFLMLHADTGTDEYLGAALADSLITKLSNVRRVSVRSTRSVMEHRGKDPVAAGHALAVDYVLDGHLRMSGGRMRITVQLISVRERSPVWAAQFDERAEDLLKLEDALSSQVTQALIPHLSRDERREPSHKQTVNPKAYQAYLKGRWHWSLQNEASMAKALLAFSEAIAEDPEYANAHAGLADYYIWLGMWGGLPAAECFLAAKSAAKRAVELDHSLADAHASLGFSLWAHDHDTVAAQRELHTAIELNPALGRAHQWLGMLHSSLQHHEQAVACLEQARSTDAGCAIFASIQALCLYYAREYGRAISILNSVPGSESEQELVTQIKAWCYLQDGQKEKALPLAKRAAELSGRSAGALMILACATNETGDKAGAERILREMEGLAQERYVSKYFLALVNLSLGNRKECIRCLQQARNEGDWWVLWANVQPRFDVLRRDPAFRADVGAPLPSIGTTKKQYAKRIAVGATLAAALLACAWFAWTRRQTTPFQRFELTKLTTNGLAAHAAISPDGKYVAYALREQGKQALWLRHTSAPNALKITPPLDAELMRLSFSADSNSVTFVAVQANDVGHGTLYQIPVLGGTLQKVADNISGPASLSPDKSQLVSIRGNPSQRQDEMYLSAPDGTGERLLAVRHYPDRFSWPDTPAWSADGKRILCGIEGSDSGGFYIYPASVSVADGSFQIIRSKRWQYLEQAAWLGDGGIMSIGREQDSSFQHMWYLPYPSGKAEPINKDLSNYTGLTATSDNRSMVSVQIQTTTNLYVTKPGKPTVQVTPGLGRYFDVKWTPDGKFVYASDASGTAELWAMAADGSGQRQLTTGIGRSYAPVVSPDNSFLLFHSNRTGNWNIWRMSLDGSKVQQLTFGVQDSNWPQFSVDGKWVIYHHTGAEAMWNLWKVPVAGGPAVQLTTKLSTNPAVSPVDGRIACWFSEDGVRPRLLLAVLPSEGGDKPLRRFEVPSGVATDSPLRWTPQSKGVSYINNIGGSSNIWVQPLDGGAAYPVTNFSWGQIYSFDWASDGSLLYSRGLSTNDVVLLQDRSR